MPELTRTCALCPKPFVTGDSVRQFADGFAHDACIASWVTVMKKERQAATPPPARLPTEKAAKPAPDKSVKKSELAKALPPQTPAFDSKLEQAYWLHLQRQVHAGEIRRADHHVEKLFLGEGSWYTPDFRVIATDGTVEFHETKGFMREAARVRLLVAATTHPYRFFLVKNKGSTKTPVWEILRVGSGTD